MAKSDDGNNAAENNRAEDKLKRIEVLAEKLSKTDAAFGARFQELMKFSISISSTEQELKNHANLHKEDLEKIDKRLKLSEKTVSSLSTKTQELEKTIGQYKESVDAYIKRIDSPLDSISREQLQLSHKFNLLQNAVEQEHRLQKVIIWSYRLALIAVAISFLYYQFSINRDINSINNTLNNLSEEMIQIRQIKQQNSPTNASPVDNKPKSNNK